MKYTVVGVWDDNDEAYVGHVTAKDEDRALANAQRKGVRVVAVFFGWIYAEA